MSRFLSWLLSDTTIAISLYPFGIFLREGYYNTIKINHESIHIAQQKEMLIIPFYLWYLIEFLIRLITQPKKQAYRKISFEKEAYSNEQDFNYLNHRKIFNWIKYL